MDCTILSINKNRIQTQYDELLFHSEYHSELVEDDWGDMQEVTYITGQLSKGSSKERISNRQESKRNAAEVEKQKRIDLNYVGAFKLVANTPVGTIYGKGEIREVLGIGAAESQAVISRLLKDGYLISRNLTKEERDRTGKRAGLFVGKDLLADLDCQVGASGE
jgi:hypothetical protein